MKFRTSFTLATLVLTVMLMSAFMPQAPAPKKFNNLKVLPKDINNDDLHKVMDGYNLALGVKCNFCHAASQDDPKHLDFKSDAKPEKEMARNMIRMANKINKKYFHIQDADNTKAVLAVSCYTCHNGTAYPESK